MQKIIDLICNVHPPFDEDYIDYFFWLTHLLQGWNLKPPSSKVILCIFVKGILCILGITESYEPYTAYMKFVSYPTPAIWLLDHKQ